MALFRKKAVPTTGTVSSAGEARWAIGKGEVGGKPLIVRWDTAAKQGSPDRARPVKVTIGIQCANPRDDGLPSPEDLALFEQMEDALFSELPPIADSEPVLILTTNAMREWILYASSREWLKSWAPPFCERFMADRPGKVEAVDEPGWETFTEWTAV